MANPLDPKTSLGFLATLLAMDVVQVLRSSLVRAAADAVFEANQPDLFHTNPANTLTYVALRALEDRAIVHVSETLKNENRVFNLPTSLRGKLDLTFHRHALSHPTTIRWRMPGMQPFYDAKRHWKDNRAAIVWDLQRSINDELVKLGLQLRVTTIEVTGEMAALLATILRSSMRPESIPRAPSEEMLLKDLAAKRDEWIQILEQLRPTPAPPTGSTPVP